VGHDSGREPHAFALSWCLRLLVAQKPQTSYFRVLKRSRTAPRAHGLRTHVSREGVHPSS